MGIKLTFLGHDSSGAVVSTPGQARAAGHRGTVPLNTPLHSAAATRHKPAIPPPFPAVARAPNGVLLHPVLQGSRDGPWQGSGRSCPPRKAGWAEPGGWVQLCPLPALAAGR